MQASFNPREPDLARGAALKHADNRILDMDNASVEEFDELRASYKILAENARREIPQDQQGKAGAAERA